MLIDTSAMFSMTEANLNFSPVARTVEREGRAVILRHSKPKYLIVPIDHLSEEELSALEKIILKGDTTQKSN